MQITKTTQTNTAAAFEVEGRLDTVTAPELEKALSEVPESVSDLTLNFKKLDYISSAGLRVLLAMHKKMLKHGGELVITDTNEVVDEIFEVTGFSDILTIK